MSTFEESRVEWFHVFNVPSDAKHRVILQRGFVLLRVTIFTLERFHGIRGILQCRLQTGFIFSLSLCPSVRPSRLNKRQYTFRIVKSISKTDSQSKFLEEKFFRERKLGRILENTGLNWRRRKKSRDFIPVKLHKSDAWGEDKFWPGRAAIEKPDETSHLAKRRTPFERPRSKRKSQTFQPQRRVCSPSKTKFKTQPRRESNSVGFKDPLLSSETALSFERPDPKYREGFTKETF